MKFSRQFYAFFLFAWPFTHAADAAGLSPSALPYLAQGGPANPIPPGPVAPTWDSIRDHYTVPAWLQDAKFGIFIHWGVYSVPAHFSEWYPRHMYVTPAVIAWHREHFGPQDQFGYKDFIPHFKAEHFDPAAWAALFKRAGARYVVPVAEHHDGFAMYDSALTKWNAKQMGPHRDVIGELAAAVRAEGLVFGLSEHRMEHWSFLYPAPGLATDVFNPAFADFYGPPQPPGTGMQLFEGRIALQSDAFLEEWLHRNQELVDKYHPSLVYFDNGINARALDPIKLRFAAYYFNRAHEWGQQVTLATKRDAYLEGSIRDFERGRTEDIRPEFWQCDTTVGSSWGYVEGLLVRPAGAMIRELVDVVSKNGGYLLNIAPKADGTIPDDQQLRLLEIGDWLRVNGEAIYGSRPWVRYGEGPTPQGAPTEGRGIIDGMMAIFTAQDLRFTIQPAPGGGPNYTLYATLLAWPADGKITITSLALPAATTTQGKEIPAVASSATPIRTAGEVTGVALLGNPKPVTFTRDTTGLHVTLPAWRPSDFANVLKITGLKQP